METSNEMTSFTENSPLLDKSPAPDMNYRDTPTNPRRSILTCAVFCILFTELCERLTFYGVTGNLVLFATESDHLNMSPADASILSYMFQGITCMTGIFGGWLADSKFGKFSVILFSAVIYFLGTLLLPLASIASNDKNAEKSQWAANDVTTNRAFMQAVYITALFLVAFGTGGIKANVSPFGAEQVSNRGPAAIQAIRLLLLWKPCASLLVNLGFDNIPQWQTVLCPSSSSWKRTHKYFKYYERSA